MSRQNTKLKKKTRKSFLNMILSCIKQNPDKFFKTEKYFLLKFNFCLIKNFNFLIYIYRAFLLAIKSVYKWRNLINKKKKKCHM